MKRLFVATIISLILIYVGGAYLFRDSTYVYVKKSLDNSIKDEIEFSIEVGEESYSLDEYIELIIDNIKELGEAKIIFDDENDEDSERVYIDIEKIRQELFIAMEKALDGPYVKQSSRQENGTIIVDLDIDTRLRNIMVYFEGVELSTDKIEVHTKDEVVQLIKVRSDQP